MVGDRTRRKSGRLRRATRRVKTSRVGRQVGFLRRTARKTRRRSHRIRRGLRRHNLGLVASLVGVVTTVTLAVFVGVGSVVTILTGFVTIAVTVGSWVLRNATPAEQVHVRRGDKVNAASARPTPRPRARPTRTDDGPTTPVTDADESCGARCQRSTASRDQCECPCGGRRHGSGTRRRGAPRTRARRVAGRSTANG